jgi:hypothetical protein
MPLGAVSRNAILSHGVISWGAHLLFSTPLRKVKRGKEALEAWKLGAGKALPVTRTPRDQRADNVRITFLASSVL